MNRCQFGGTGVSVKNRISVSFDDQEFHVLERLSSHIQRSKAEIIRTIVTEYLRENPDRFRLKTTVGIERNKNIVFLD
jgi:metal-responsive CopG/Arc/MetJ family transcriptional regulator